MSRKHKLAVLQAGANMQDFLLRLSSDTRGSVIAWFAGGVFMLTGFAALGVDTAYLYYVRSQLQNAADSASLAAAALLPDDADARNEALSYAQLNMPSAQYGVVVVATDVRIGIWDTDTRTFTDSVPSGGLPNAVEVIARRASANSNPVSLYFARIFGGLTTNVVVRSIAARGAGSDPACILALDPTSSGAVTITGNTTIVATDCSIKSNSRHQDGAMITGSSDSTVSCVGSAGGVTVQGSGTTLTTTDCIQPVTSLAATADPYDYLEMPAETPCLEPPKFSPGQTYTLTSGTYCSLDLKGNVILEPGTYVVSGGDLRINSTANVSGSGVTFITTAGASVTLNGGAIVDISAPSSGEYSGILFHGDPADGNLSHVFNGTSDTLMNGAIHFPEASVTMNGANSNDGFNCTQVVARFITLSGDASFGHHCDDVGIVPIPLRGLISLVL